MDLRDGARIQSDASEPRSEKFRKAGLTQTESERLDRTLRRREETRGFWRAAPLGMLAWLVWKLFYRGFQPAWMLASIAGAAWFGLLILQDLGGLGVVATAPPDLRDRIETVFAQGRSPRDNVYGLWVEELTAALDGDLRRRADLDRLEIWAEAGPYYIGRDRLALERLANGQDVGALEAQLRAQPPQVRAERLAAALAEPVRLARARGLTPEEMAYAPESLQQRYLAAQSRWSLASDPVNAFLRGSASGQLDIRSQPGLSRRQAGDVYLYDGVRHVVIQACLAPGGRRTLSALCPADLPRQGFDPFLLALAAWETGMLDNQSSRAAQGARLVRAAYTAGRLSPVYEAHLREVFEASLPPNLVLDSLEADGFDPAEAYPAPRRYRQSLRGSLDVPASSEVLAGIHQSFELLYEIQEATSPSLAVRFAGILEQPQDAASLMVLVEEMGSGAFALYQSAGGAMYDIIHVEPVSGEAEPSHIRALSVCLLSALIVLLLSLRRIATPQLIRQASRLRGLDAFLSRLFLGRKT